MHELDARLFFSVFRSAERTWSRTLARTLSRSADGYLYVLLPLALWLAQSPLAEDFCKLLCLALGAERCAYLLLKNGLRRRRPQERLVNFHSVITAGDRFSFPSGHTSAAFLLATSLTLVYQEPAASLYLWASTVGLSRVILGVHYPGDTVAGAVMGSAIAFATANFLGV
ncbi:MAG: phosphatase PAP2 family protein [Halioglobus sp.]|nr:phosphatase PAP2 family protein [Halioglobus sp.]